LAPPRCRAQAQYATAQGEDASPYLNHPPSPADVLADEDGVTDIEVLCAAFLHETIQDTETRVDELRTVFGATIAGIVVDSTTVRLLPDKSGISPTCQFA
jgi:(p)ppGpp synthase/HD superfamily hydrolase